MRPVCRFFSLSALFSAPMRTAPPWTARSRAARCRIPPGQIPGRCPSRWTVSRLRARVPPAALAGALLGIVATDAGPVLGQATETLPDAGFESVDWPPPGPRLRELAARLDFDIGFAARRNWPALPEPGVAETYGEIARAEFGTLTPESSAKWEFVHPFEGDYDFDEQNDLDALVSFAEENGMRVHGHPLTWYLLNPVWLASVPPERMESVLRAHIDTVVSRYAGRIDVWDVVNEGLDNDGNGFREEDPFFAALGSRYMDVAFEAARAADPGAELIYNDFDIGWLTTKSALALSLVDDLIARDVPIDGIGMQMHLDHTFPHFEGFSEAMQRFVDRDLDVYVTELDVRILSEADLGVQADVYEQVVSRCLMQPRCRATQIWGLNDFYSWQPFFSPLPFDDDFRVKPAYFGLQRALMKQPLHPERCASGEGVTGEGTRIARGTVYAERAGDAWTLDCGAMSLEGGFGSLAVRYRNPGTELVELELRANGVTLVTVPLEPTRIVDEVDYRTVTVEIPPTSGVPELALALGAAARRGPDVGVDALLFGEPTETAAADGRRTGRFGERFVRWRARRPSGGLCCSARSASYAVREAGDRVVSRQWNDLSRLAVGTTCRIERGTLRGERLRERTDALRGESSPHAPRPLSRGWAPGSRADDRSERPRAHGRCRPPRRSVPCRRPGRTRAGSRVGRRPGEVATTAPRGPSTESLIPASSTLWLRSVTGLQANGTSAALTASSISAAWLVCSTSVTRQRLAARRRTRAAVTRCGTTTGKRLWMRRSST